MDGQIISLEKFLERYLFISNRQLSKITHKDVKVLLPELKRCSFEYTEKNPEEVGNGNVILVMDSKGNIVPYLKPEITYTQVSEVSVTPYREKEERIDTSDLSLLSDYELTKLLNQKKNGYGVARKAKGELASRGKVKTKRKENKRYNKYYEED